MTKQAAPALLPADCSVLRPKKRILGPHTAFILRSKEREQTARLPHPKEGQPCLAHVDRHTHLLRQLTSLTYQIHIPAG